MAYMQRLLPFLIALGLATPAGEFLEPDSYHDFVEMFSGMQSVSDGARAFHFDGVAIDKKHGEIMNMLTPAGFLFALGSVMKIKRGGFLWLAPPCSTWVFFSRHSSGRKHNPLGNGKHMTTIAQNRLVSRLCHILWVAFKRAVYVVIEQPISSLMKLHPRLMRLLRKFNYISWEMDMGAFCGFSQKRTMLLTNAPWVEKVAIKCDQWTRRVIQEEPLHDTVTLTELLSLFFSSLHTHGAPPPQSQLWAAISSNVPQELAK